MWDTNTLKKKKKKKKKKKIIIIIIVDIPIIRFDDTISSCYTEQSNGDIYLLVSPIENLPENYEIIDYLWKQKEGNELKCTDRFIFIYIYIYIYI